MMKTLLALAAILVLLSAARGADKLTPPEFKPQTIDDKVQIGYGVAIADVDGDGKPDILLADKKQFVWYRNPTWEKFVIAENLTEQDNVCIAARDLDGDGRAEIAVGAQWNPGDTVNSGAVFYLIPPKDRTQKWTPVKLHHEPTVHRMHWVKMAKDKYCLVVAPLHGRGNRNGEGDGVRLLAYEMPADPTAEWKTTVVDDTMHVTHNLDPVQWDPASEAEELLYVGREGALLLSLADGKWTKQKFPRIEGSGEVRMGKLSGESLFIATIEPFHGDKLVLYRSGYDRKSGSEPTAIAGRTVLDDGFNQGHAIATADLAGNGTQQIVAGWRNPNRDKKVGVKLYYPTDRMGAEWAAAWIDENGMATEDLRIGDLNADGRPDIVAAGRDTHNLKIYWNQGVKP